MRLKRSSLGEQTAKKLHASLENNYRSYHHNAISLEIRNLYDDSNEMLIISF